MRTPQAELVLDARNATGESPVWQAAEQALYWVDIPARELCRWSPATGQLSRWQAPEMLACVAMMPAANTWIAGAESGLFQLELKDGGQVGFERLAAVSHALPGMRFNDGRCDRAGRFWVSSMVLDMSLAAPFGALYRFDAQGLSAPRVSELIVGNGLAFSPRGDRLYLSDSHPTVQRIWHFDLHDDGSLSNRREFVDMNQHPGRPDGAAVDADGCYWICGNDAGVLLRFTPEGRLDRTLALPISKPSMCAFGGAALDQLFVTSITPAQPAAGFDASLDGAVLMLRPGVRGLPEVACAATRAHT